MGMVDSGVKLFTECQKKRFSFGMIIVIDISDRRASFISLPADTLIPLAIPGQ